jgi:hypothetical protein
VYDEKGRPIGEKDITTTEQDYIRQREIPGTETPGDSGPNFKEDCEGIVMNVGNTSRSGKFKCDLDPNPPINTPGETVDPEVKEDMYTDSNVEEVYRPYEPDPEPEPVVVRDRFNTSSGSLRGKGLEFTLPQLEGMSFSQLKAAKSKCGSCKSAGLINVLLGRRSG